jgi:hypothetical protein
MIIKEQINSPNRTARLAGLLYLAFFVFFFIADNGIHSTPVGSVDAVTIAANIAASEWLFRVGFVSFLLSAVFFLLSAWALYALLKPVNKDYALLLVFLNLAGVAIKCISLLSEFAALTLLNGSVYIEAFDMDQLQALAVLFLDIYKDGFMMAQIFFGLWLLPLGYLVFKSGFLPKILGVLLILDCFAILIWFFQFFLFPGYETINYPFLAISFIAEASLCLWLLIKGVNVKMWEKQVLETA